MFCVQRDNSVLIKVLWTERLLSRDQGPDQREEPHGWGTWGLWSLQVSQ